MHIHLIFGSRKSSEGNHKHQIGLVYENDKMSYRTTEYEWILRIDIFFCIDLIESTVYFSNSFVQ